MPQVVSGKQPADFLQRLGVRRTFAGGTLSVRATSATCSFVLCGALAKCLELAEVLLGWAENARRIRRFRLGCRLSGWSVASCLLPV